MPRPHLLLVLLAIAGCRGADEQAAPMGSAAVPTSSQASPAGTPGGPPASASAASANRDEVAAPPAIDAAKVVASLGGACSDAGTVALHFSPAEPAPGHTLSVIAVASDGAPLDGLVAIDGAC
ncbi:MAG TPA: hypothetical protein VL400_12785, partial [Polyangiaceae bacterium]|nr:hypothetical protein [Polyangiaceae bacterium]